ncbi:MAG: hypothetical protein IJZ53_03100 [Tyzzerella sp.]|nr:hypothetical protein [Tyzzerella sp.]
MKGKWNKWLKTGVTLMICGALVFASVTSLADSAKKRTAVINLSGSDYNTSNSKITAKASTKSLNTVKTSIFGGNISWIDEGYGLWNTEDDEPYAIMTEKLKKSGVQHLRYPGGIEGDYFHWYETIGDLSERVNQINCFSSEYPTYDAYNGVEYPVEFGVDELFAVCEAADIGATIQLNAGNGTTDEAVDYVNYLIDKGYIDDVDSICIGNEVCMDDEKVDGITISKNPVDYTNFCKEVLQKVGKDVVDSDSIKLGVIGITPSHPLCAYKNWDAIVLDSLASEIDFIDVHIGYSYYYQNNESAEESVKCFLASAKWIESMIEEEEAIIKKYAGEYADDVDIQITECGPVGGNYPNSLAGSLFLADFYNTVLRHSKITATDYLPVLNHYASAQIIGACTYSGASANEVYWDNCVSYVFKWYADQIGRDVLETEVKGAKTFDSSAVGMVPAIEDVEEGTVQVYYDEATGEGSVFVINKSMNENLEYDIELPVSDAKITNVTELWNQSPIAKNTHTSPETVVPVLYDEYNGAFSGIISLTTKPVSLVKIDFTTEDDVKVTYASGEKAEVPKEEMSTEDASNKNTSDKETVQSTTNSGSSNTVTDTVVDESTDDKKEVDEEKEDGSEDKTEVKDVVNDETEREDEVDKGIILKVAAIVVLGTLLLAGVVTGIVLAYKAMRKKK